MQCLMGCAVPISRPLDTIGRFSCCPAESIDSGRKRETPPPLPPRTLSCCACQTGWRQRRLFRAVQLGCSARRQRRSNRPHRPRVSQTLVSLLRSITPMMYPAATIAPIALFGGNRVRRCFLPYSGGVDLLYSASAARHPAAEMRQIADCSPDCCRGQRRGSHHRVCLEWRLRIQAVDGPIHSIGALGAVLTQSTRQRWPFFTRVAAKCRGSCVRPRRRACAVSLEYSSLHLQISHVCILIMWARLSK